MASGIFGQAALTASTNTTIYAVPASTYSVVTVNIVNRGTSSAAVRLAVSSSANPTDNEYLEYDTVLPAKNVLERTGIVAEAGRQIIVYADTNSISASAYGIEQEVV